MRIPVQVLKDIAKKYDLTHIVMLAYHPEAATNHVVTYGKSVEDCSEAADFGNTLKTSLGWPEALHQQPSRVKKLQDELELWKSYAAFCRSCAMSREEPYSFEEFQHKHNQGK
jgi:hypothetical protein